MRSFRFDVQIDQPRKGSMPQPRVQPSGAMRNALQEIVRQAVRLLSEM